MRNAGAIPSARVFNELACPGGCPVDTCPRTDVRATRDGGVDLAIPSASNLVTVKTMEMTFSPAPPPPHVWLAYYLAAVLLGALLAAAGGFLHNRVKSEVLRVFLGLVAVAGYVWSGILGFVQVYPHHHHDIQWITGRWTLNYWIDVVLGVLTWLLLVIVWRKSWRKSSGGTV